MGFHRSASSAEHADGSESVPHRPPRPGVWFKSTIEGGGKQEYRPAPVAAGSWSRPFEEFDECMTERRTEADHYYADPAARHRLGRTNAWCSGRAFRRTDLEQAVLPLGHSALAQGAIPANRRRRKSRLHGRNAEWRNLNNSDIVFHGRTNGSIPWYALLGSGLPLHPPSP